MLQAHASRLLAVLALAVMGPVVWLTGCGSPQGTIADGEAVDGGDLAINLEQGWSREVQDRSWFASFGSRLLPYAWLMALEQAGSEQDFVADAQMEALGFLRQRPSANNPDGLPVGFTRTAGNDGESWAGLGCAACHTGELRYRGNRIRLDGGPGLIDFDGFEAALVDALAATLSEPARFERFAKRVGAEDRPALKAALTARVEALQARRRMNHSELAYGHGRLDAFGQIFNAIAVEALGIADNRRAPDAPVSFPALWSASHLDVVQWNGSAPNAGPGPLFQNIITALAVYGTVDLGHGGGLRGHASSVDFERLGQIQDDLYHLQAPRWPEQILGPLDRNRVARGAAVYAGHCASCHALSDRETKRELRTTLVAVDSIGTDPRTARNFLGAEADTGILQGRRQGVVAGEPFGARAQTIQLVVHAAVGAALQHPLAATRDAVTGYHPVIKAAIDQHPDHYKARPLDGVWATAPYLHNGSVPSLAELLKPPAERVRRFGVGQREYDPAAVGYLSAVADNPFLFDTGLPGNGNGGHLQGTALGEAEKADLLEYLKSL